MTQYKRGDPIPYLNDGAGLFTKPMRRAEKNIDPRAQIAVLQKTCADLKRKHQRTLAQFSTAAVKSGRAGELEALEQQIAETEAQTEALQASDTGIGEYLDGHVAAVKTQHDLRRDAQRQDAGWDYLLTRKAGRYDESKHPRNPKGSGRNAGRFAPKGGGAQGGGVSGDGDGAGDAEGKKAIEQYQSRLGQRIERLDQLRGKSKRELADLFQASNRLDVSHIKSESPDTIRYAILDQEFPLDGYEKRLKRMGYDPDAIRNSFYKKSARAARG